MGRRAMQPGDRGEAFVSPQEGRGWPLPRTVLLLHPDGVRMEATAKARTKGLARGAVEAKVNALLSAAATRPATVRETVWAWLDSRPEKTDDSRGISPQTRAGYAGHINRTITPAIGDLPVADVTAGRIQRLLESIVSEGRGYGTANSVLAVLAPALRGAVIDGHIQINLAAECRAPLPSKKKPRGRWCSSSTGTTPPRQPWPVARSSTTSSPSM
jgi:hypothetical protein